MVITRTPFRISFFGGGTDYPNWYRKHGGAVLATTINKYCYITCRYLPPFFEHRYVIAYSRLEYCRTIDEISHPAVREVLRHSGCDRGLEIHNDSDLPARSGLGSSSAFTVGLVHALHALKGCIISKHRLAMEAVYIEQEMLKETVGSQDQVLAAYGGLRHVTFLPDGEISARPLTVAAERLKELNSHLMLFYTGIKRTASTIAQSYVNRIEDKKRELRIMKDLVEESIAVLTGGGDIIGFGELLDEAWHAKRSLSPAVSNSYVDELYTHAVSCGAVGGKLIGAGGGGFLLLFVPPAKQESLKSALGRLIHVPFRFESAGSQIIFFDEEEDYRAEEQARAGRSLCAFQELTAIEAGIKVEGE